MDSSTQIAILLALSLFGCNTSPPPTSEAEFKPASEPPPAQEVPTAEPEGQAKKHAKPKAKKARDRKTFEVELFYVDNDRDGFEALAAKAPSRLHDERIAGIYMQRARLTGSYEDYAKAEAMITRAFELAPAGSTFMLRAKLHYTLHRLPEARADFEEAKPKLQPTPDATASIQAFEGNLAMQAGSADEAEKHFSASLDTKRTHSNLASYAVFQWKTGNFDKAEEFFRESLKLYHGKPMEPRAWIHLNLGLLDLDRGRYDDALAHYREAESFLKGYWLIDEHIAEILTLQGKTDEAKALYLDIIERTNNPEFMDAMAGIAFEAGDEEEGKKWVEKARARYEEQMAQFPEAAYGHALGHFIEFGDDPAYVLELAKKNYALRPNLEAAVMLAQAELKAGDPKAAAKALKPTLASKFKSAELYLTAAEVQSKLGNEKQAQAFLQQAKAIDPTSSLEDDETQAPAAEG